jgi:hypothetical protein
VRQLLPPSVRSEGVNKWQIACHFGVRKEQAMLFFKRAGKGAKNQAAAVKAA